MRIPLFVVILLGLIPSIRASAHKEGACAEDNCLRAVTGTRRGASAITAARGDCSSFLSSTTTLATRTATTSILTITATITVSGNGNNKRSALSVSAGTISTKTVPSYATACSGTSRYSSACSCWGITASTITVTPIVCDVISKFLL